MGGRLGTVLRRTPVIRGFRDKPPTTSVPKRPPKGGRSPPRHIRLSIPGRGDQPGPRPPSPMGGRFGSVLHRTTLVRGLRDKSPTTSAARRPPEGGRSSHHAYRVAPAGPGRPARPAPSLPHGRALWHCPAPHNPR